IEPVALRYDARARERAYCARADVEDAEPSAAGCGPFVRVDDRLCSEQIQVDMQVCRSNWNGCAQGRQTRIDRCQLVADARLPRRLVEIGRLVRTGHRPRAP